MDQRERPEARKIVAEMRIGFARLLETSEATVERLNALGFTKEAAVLNANTRVALAAVKALTAVNALAEDAAELLEDGRKKDNPLGGDHGR